MPSLIALQGMLDWIDAAGGHPVTQLLAIIAGTFVLEDATTLAVALLVADGHLSMPVALAGLYSGIVLGDFWLYGMGRLAASHRRGEAVSRHHRLAPFRGWLETRMTETVFAVRFVPGLRLPTYTASGFFRLPFRRFAATVVLATAVWTTALFFAAYWLGAATAEALGPWRWVLAAVAVGGLLLIGRRNARRFGYNGRARRDDPAQRSVESKDARD